MEFFGVSRDFAEDDYTGHGGGADMTAWGAAKAKARFSEVLDKAQTEGPQLVTRRKEEFWVVTRERLSEVQSNGGLRETMAEFMMRSPLRESGMKIGRVNLRARKIEL
jgi:prevent-host-death family protein